MDRTLQRKLAVLGIVSVLVVPTNACGTSTPIDIARSSTHEEVDCDFARATYLTVQPTCYEVIVPEDWSKPDGENRVSIRVAVFEATSDIVPAREPLIYLDGGPGSSTLDTLAVTSSQIIDPYVAGRDVIVFDQRGAGTSRPSLACSEVVDALRGNAQSQPIDRDDASGLAATTACHHRLLAAGVDLAMYNSEASARDIEAVRLALGYQQVDVLAVSYGTRLAQTLMRLYPTSLDSVVLDSVVPVEAHVLENLPTSYERSMRMVFEACRADRDCHQAYPTFESDLFDLMDQLDAEPIPVDIIDAENTPRTVIVDGDDLMRLVALALYEPSLFSSLPKLVADTTAGDHRLLGSLASADFVRRDYFSDGMHYSVMCHDEVPFESADRMTANLPTAPGYARLETLTGEPNLFEACEAWAAGAAPGVEDEPVASQVPTLLLSGAFDPVTPPDFAKAVAGHLDESYLVEFPTGGHAITKTECGTAVVVDFLLDPRRAPNSSCVAVMTPPAWVVDEGAEPDVELVAVESGATLGLGGVRPAGWIEQAPGVLVRGESLADPTVLVLQAIPEAGRVGLLPGIESQLGVSLTETEATELGGVMWTRFEGINDEMGAALLVAPESRIIVLLTAEPQRLQQLVELVALPVADSLTLPR